MFLQIIIYPISEEVWCGENECRTREEHIIYNREEFRGFRQLRDKQNIEVYELRDEHFPINQYFLRSQQSLVFSTGYLIRENAERDLNILRNNNNITLTKKNTVLIIFLCICLYIILQSLGIIVNILHKEIKNE